MRDLAVREPELLELEIAARREDLVRCISELQQIARQTFDVKARLLGLSRRAIATVRKNPKPYVAAAGVLVTLGVFALVLRHRARSRPPELRLVL
jgi:hypothetical protein